MPKASPKEETVETVAPDAKQAVSDAEIEGEIEGKLPAMPQSIRKKMITVQGGRKYLQVADRLIWMRQFYPEWGIETSIVQLDMEKGFAVCHARVKDEAGRIRGEGLKHETARGFGDFIEKASTGAIGRALAVAGFGTQFTGDEFDEGERIVDSPNGHSRAPSSVGKASQTPIRGNGAAQHDTISVGFATCAECNRPLTKGQSDHSTVRFGRPLCPSHQNGAAKPAEETAPQSAAPADVPGRITRETFDAIAALCETHGYDADKSADTFTRGRAKRLGDLAVSEGEELLSTMQKRLEEGS